MTGIPEPDPMGIAVRAHTERVRPDEPGAPRDRSKERRKRCDGSVLVFDCETATDAAQALTFGCWRYLGYRAGKLTLLDEGLFHADELPEEDPAGFNLLQDYARTHSAGTSPPRPLGLLSRTQFVDQVLIRCAYVGASRVVGFNLPFDLSRIAIDVGEGRGRNRGGFSFILGRGNAAKGYAERKHVPRVQVRHISSKRAQISFARALNPIAHWPGEFIDLRTLTFGLTSVGHSLQSACEAFGVPGKSDPGGHGVITEQYIDYCRADVEATHRLYLAARAALDALGLPITMARVNSPASLSKAILDGMGVTPHNQRSSPLPPETTGLFMSAFYGGRAECRIRRTEVPVRLVDFTSMYPTVFALMGLWRYCIADELTTVDATDDVRALLESATLAGTFDPGLWPQLAGIALVQPDADILPIRARYDPHRPGYNIGVNHLTSEQPLWYAIPDLFASTLLTGKPPRIIRAIRLHAQGTLDTLKPLTLPGGRVIDPAVEAPWPEMIAERQKLKRNQALNPAERDRAQLFLKIAANAGSFGIYAEYNRDELPKGEKADVLVHSKDGTPFHSRLNAPEDPGRYSCPPLAAIITSAARLMLAMLERCVTDHGGSYAFCDTDSMAIVATEHGGPIACEGGSIRTNDGKAAVLALSHHQVDAIRTCFNTLNPYDRDAVPDILKTELDTNCYAIAAKRYALYRYGPDVRPTLVPASEHQPCSHGLGHLLNPTNPDSDSRDWIVQLWEHELRSALGIASTRPPEWHQRPALGGRHITSPLTWRAMSCDNATMSYRTGVKPFNFLLHAPGAIVAGTPNRESRLVAPYTNDPRRWPKLSWIDLDDTGRAVSASTDKARPVDAHLETLASVASTYLLHRELKSIELDGRPCGRHTAGRLARRHVRAARIALIGKEANDLEDRTANLRQSPRNAIQQEYA